MSSPEVCLFGTEIEYSVPERVWASFSVPPCVAVDAFRDAVRRRSAHLRSGAGRTFLENGACFYIDQGAKPEYCTPECSHPDEIVEYQRAGDLLLWDAASDFGRRFGTGPVPVFKGNCDYGGSGNAWGAHESYLTSRRHSIAEINAQICPHLVSRIIFTGAGGFDNRSPDLQFVLSPRVPQLRHVQSADTTAARGLLNTRDESLSDARYQRLHVCAGDSNLSERSTWLKVATTALVVRLADVGVPMGAAVALRRPLATLRATAASTVVLRNRVPERALAIQQHYLRLVERHLGSDFMPPWAAAVCGQWQVVLDALKRDPSGLVGILDWPTKLALYSSFVEEQGSSREALMFARLRRQPPPSDELEAQLFELDTRFGKLGDGLFQRLDRRGLLAHGVSTPRPTARVLREPPARGRARARSLIVRETRDPRVHLDWDRVVDGRGPELRTATLEDPFLEISSVAELDWQDYPGF